MRTRPIATCTSTPAWRPACRTRWTWSRASPARWPDPEGFRTRRRRNPSRSRCQAEDPHLARGGLLVAPVARELAFEQRPGRLAFVTREQLRVHEDRAPFADDVDVRMRDQVGDRKSTRLNSSHS